MSLSQVLGLLLAISLAGNAFLGKAYLGQRDTAVVATAETKQADGVAKACTEGVKTLATQADKRHKEATPKVEAARQQAEAHDKRADEILATPAAVPGDACKSAQAVADDWWARKAKP